MSKNREEKSWAELLNSKVKKKEEKDYEKVADLLYPTMKEKKKGELIGKSNKEKKDSSEIENNKESKNLKAISYFLRNYQDMKEANTIGADKYFHAKANCQVGQIGDIIPALSIDTARELSDFLIANPIKQMKDKNKKVDVKGNLSDSLKDFDANLYGLKRGKENPNIDCRYLVKKYRPKGLDEKY